MEMILNKTKMKKVIIKRKNARIQMNQYGMQNSKC